MTITPDSHRPVATPPGNPAAIGDVISFMADDKSNDWSSEIETLKGVDAELASLRQELETYRANIGPVDAIVTASRYARLGRYTAALLGSRLIYNGADICADLSAYWGQIGSPAIGGQDGAALTHWRRVADILSIDYDADETAEED